MKWRMEISSSPSSNISNSSWVIEESRSTKWTQAENKQFEDSLARFDKDTPDRWQKVAAMVPGKTVADVMKQYKELEDDVSSIEAGLVPIPGYNNTSPFTLEWGNRFGFDGFRPSSGGGAGGKRSAATGGRPSEQERKKGVPWTEEEHRLFLLGLKKYGKGDWRNISRNFVISRTPTQVASHAQKYFIRQLLGGKDKRRASIHDITTVNVAEHHLVDAKHSPLHDQHSATTHPHHPLSFQWSQPRSDALSFNQGNNNMFGSLFGEGAYEQKVQVVQPTGVDGVHESYSGPQRTGFQMRSGIQYQHL